MNSNEFQGIPKKFLGSSGIPKNWLEALRIPRRSYEFQRIPANSQDFLAPIPGASQGTDGHGMCVTLSRAQACIRTLPKDS